MDHARLQRLHASFAHVQPCGPAFIARIMHALERRHPIVHAAARPIQLHLKNAPPDDHAHLTARANTLTWMTFEKVVANLGKFRSLEAPLTALGIRLSATALQPAHFQALREETLRALAELQPDSWSERLREDWTLALQAASGAILKGLLQTRADTTSASQSASSRPPSEAGDCCGSVGLARARARAA